MDLDTLKLYEKRCRELKSYFEKNTETGDYQEYYNMLESYSYFNELMTYDAFESVLKHKRSRRLKRYRANKKLTKLEDYRLSHAAERNQKLVFGTLTLDNKTLYFKNGNKKKIRTITKKIDKYVNEVFDYAIINVDYGEKTERLHFHLIGLIKNEYKIIENGKKSKKGFPMYSIKNDKYDLGFNDYEIIDIEDNRKLTNYLLKINNHTNKPSTKNHRIRVIGNKELIKNINDYEIFMKELLLQK